MTERASRAKDIYTVLAARGGADRRFLEAIYGRFNRRAYVAPDPLQFLYDYPDLRDREIVGFVASYLAYGRVAQILKSVGAAVRPMGPSPARFLACSSPRQVRAAFRGFKHRFTTGDDLAALLLGIRRTVARHGSLNACCLAGLRRDGDLLEGSRLLVASIAGENKKLVPCPRRGSACKRLQLFLRWMVRCDEVDPGGWRGISPAQLVVPLDTHMHQVARALRLTRRNAADLRTANEITEAFRRISPDDPVKYDFALTRLGIRSDLTAEDVGG